MKHIAVMFFAAVAAFSVFAEEAAAPAPVNNRAEVSALAKEVGELVKAKKNDEALAVAEKAVTLALAHTAPEAWIVKQTAYEALGTAYSALGDREKTVDAFCKMSENHNPHFGCRFHNRGFDAITAVMREGKTDEARAYLKRVRALDKLEGRDIAVAIDVEGRCCKVDKNWKGMADVYAQGWSDTNLCASVGAVWFIDKYIASYKESTGGYKAVWEVYDDAFANPKKYGITNDDLMKRLLGMYLEASWRSMDLDRMEDARARCEKLGMDPVAKGGMYGSLLRAHRKHKDFPLSEEALNIPTDPAKYIGIDLNKKVVHAKDFGWNPTNATTCLQAALNCSNATTVIVDAMPSPWKINNVKVDGVSNRLILFKKGCTILSAPESRDKKSSDWYRLNMFDFNKVTNIWIEAEGEVGKDVYIGKYRNRKERLDVGFEYGGSIMQPNTTCRHMVFKNLWLANAGQDGLLNAMLESYVIDCLFQDNYRQGVSVCGGRENVYKNCTFCDTFGGEPHCGIDFEPYYEINSCPFHYFIDCKFYNNASKNVIFSTSTYAPMDAYFLRCEFEAQRNGNIGICARLGVYLNALINAPSKIIFEKCRIDGYSDGHANPIQFLTSMLYNVTFKDCEINDKGKLGRDGDHKCSPISLNLDRAVWDGYYPCPGIVTFDNVKINGYEGVPLIEVKDRNGKYCINSFRGSVIHNGKEISLDNFDYQPPDRIYKDAEDADVSKLNPAEGKQGTAEPLFALGFEHPWYNPLPRYKTFFSGKKGTKAVVKVADRSSPDGRDVEIAFDADGVKDVDLNMAPDARDPDHPVDGFSIKGVKGASIAYQAEKSGGLGRVIQIALGYDFAPYTGYFEVPAGKECAIKLQGGGVVIRDESGKVVVEMKSADYVGSKCITFTPEENAIWSFTMLDRNLGMKMFAPLSGIWADDPAFLPTVGEALEFSRVRRTGSAEVEMTKAKLFPLPVKADVMKAVEDAAAKRVEWANMPWDDEHNARRLYRKAHFHWEWMEPAMQDKDNLALMDAELESIEPLRKLSDMQSAAKRESEDLRKYVAFVELYAPKLVSEPSDDEDELAEQINSVINPYGVEWLEDGHIYYGNYMDVVKLAPYIVERLK